MKKLLLLLIIPTLVFAQSVFNPLPTAPISIFGIPLMSKGSLLVSDGSFLGEKGACNDTEILEYDSAEVDGLKCVAKPVDTNAGTLCAAGEYLDGDGTCKTVPSGSSPLNYAVSGNVTFFSTTSTVMTDITGLEATITTTGGPIEIDIVPTGGVDSFSDSNVTAEFQIERNGTIVANSFFNTAAGGSRHVLATLDTFDVVGAGTYTYKVRTRAVTAGTVFVSNLKIVVKEL